MNKLYNSLLSEVAKTPKLAQTTNMKRGVLLKFVEYLRTNEAQVSKFGRVTQEVCNYLDNYDFTKDCYFDDMRKKMDLLPPLRLKLVKLGDEAKKLISFPDRYNSKQSIEICKALVVSCQNKMSLDEIPKVSELIDNNLKKLKHIHGLLMSDTDVLGRIKAAIEANLSLLQGFVAYKKELDQYIAGFPHGNDDLKVVLDRIVALQQLSSVWSGTEAVINSIRANADRYAKDTLVRRYVQVVVDMQSKMCFANLQNVKRELEQIHARATAIHNLYQSESGKLRNMEQSLQQKKNQFWREEHQKLVTNLNSIIYANPNKVSYDINQLEKAHESAIRRKRDMIRMTLDQYRWLNKGDYKMKHDAFAYNFITSSEYQNKVQEIKTKRMIKLLLIPIVGWIILLVT